MRAVPAYTARPRGSGGRAITQDLAGKLARAGDDLAEARDQREALIEALRYAFANPGEILVATALEQRLSQRYAPAGSRS
jgi:hypothetical protein